MEQLDRSASLRVVAEIARDAELSALADEAVALAERQSAGRFFVACVGQFKRGKSSVLNALVNEAVLPVGVLPVTSAVTILRHAPERHAVVSFADGRADRVPIEDVALYVTEAHNHENWRAVAAVEVFLPAPVLAAGLCLVDTPGIGSTFAENTEATRAFVPHIDAALVVVGADPPMTGEELALVLDVLHRTPKAIFVLNKADRLPQADIEEAREFTERVVASRLGRPVGSVLAISAVEKAERHEPTRDWCALEGALAGLQGEAHEILQKSYDRGLARLTTQIRDDLDERTGALLRPLHESEGRIAALRRSVTEAEAMLRELGVLLAAEQRPLLKAFQDRQAAFLELELRAALDELHRWIDGLTSGRLHDRARAFDQASAIIGRRIDDWLAGIEPEADALYRDTTRRSTRHANQFLAGLKESRDSAFALLPGALEPETGLREQRRFYATSLMHLTAPGLLNRLADFLLPRAARLRRIKRDAAAYLERLLRSNTTRVVFDLERRVEVSRRKLESELRFLLQEITTSAERALERARNRQRAGQEAIADELAKLDVLKRRLDRVVGPDGLENDQPPRAIPT